MDTQEQSVLAYIRAHGSITHHEAEDAFSCTRLAARVGRLKEEGHDIVCDPEKGVNKFGKKVRYGRYRLREKYDQRELFEVKA